MPSQDHLKAIGRTLLARRTSLDPARHRTRDGWMATVTAETDLSKRVIIDIETGARSNYGQGAIRALEGLYRLRAGCLRPALEEDSPLVAESGEVLYPTSPAPEGRFRSEERRSRLSGAVWRIVRDLEADTEGLPDDVAEEMLQRAMANAEAQARIMLDADRNRWERRQAQHDAT